MVWKNFSIKSKSGNFIKKRVEKSDISKNNIEKPIIPFYTKDHSFTKDNVLTIRPKPSYIEKVQYYLRRKNQKKYSKFRTIFDNSVLTSEASGLDFKKKKKFLKRVFFKLNLNVSVLSKEYSKIYLQSKMNEGISKYKICAAQIVDKKKIEMGLPSIFQLDLRYNMFYRHFNYKTLLFRSFWFSKFISTMVIRGKKHRIWTAAIDVFSSLKFEFGRNPVMLLFEILEMYRMPLKALHPKNKTRKSIIRTHIISWWKQYTQLLRWVRHSIRGPKKTTQDWKIKFRKEIRDLIKDSPNTLIKKRIELNSQMISFSKVSLHFRWYRRYSKRAANAIKIVDRKYYI